MYLNLSPGVFRPLLPLHFTAHNHIIMTVTLYNTQKVFYKHETGRQRILQRKCEHTDGVLWGRKSF